MSELSIWEITCKGDAFENQAKVGIILKQCALDKYFIHAQPSSKMVLATVGASQARNVIRVGCYDDFERIRLVLQGMSWVDSIQESKENTTPIGRSTFTHDSMRFLAQRCAQLCTPQNPSELAGTMRTILDNLGFDLAQKNRVCAFYGMKKSEYLGKLRGISAREVTAEKIPINLNPQAFQIVRLLKAEHPNQMTLLECHYLLSFMADALLISPEEQYAIAQALFKVYQ